MKPGLVGTFLLVVVLDIIIVTILLLAIPLMAKIVIVIVASGMFGLASYMLGVNDEHKPKDPLPGLIYQFLEKKSENIFLLCEKHTVMRKDGGTLTTWEPGLYNIHLIDDKNPQAGDLFTCQERSGYLCLEKEN